MERPFVVLLGTCDTKLSELLFVRSRIIESGVDVRLADVGRTPSSHNDIFYRQSDLLSKLPTKPDLTSLDRSSIVKTMIEAGSRLVKETYLTLSLFSGIICIGGSGGTSLGASVMRSALPVGFPKLIVSTVASGNVANFVGETDITMMYSVVDIAGKNSILNPILENAAGMIAGAATVYSQRKPQNNQSSGKEWKKRAAITMFGVTTPAVSAAQAELERQGFEAIVFHATGTGGRAMENLVVEGCFDGVLDLTTTELADELVGGMMKGGPGRLTAAAKMGIPQVVSLGALDIVNFGPRDTVPSKFKERLLHEHNPDITLLRTSPDECRMLGQQVSEKLKAHAKKPALVRVFIPTGGISMLAEKGCPFHDEHADKELFGAVVQGLEDSGIEVIEDPRAINDEGFAAAMAESLIDLLNKCSRD
ncbi:MAG: hypothetical protein LQ351_006368 [Letrouitia transgressa]|nr:MAG: hypothetical protein LQ351_006368 [Letrouitia transgressa]